MAGETTNLKLKLPAAEDFYSVVDFNGNFEKIDKALAAAAPAAEYDATAAYALGSYCSYQGRLYKCVTAVPIGEAWNAAHWAATDLSAELTGKAPAVHTHTKAQITDFPASLPPAAHAASHGKTGADALAPGDIGAAVAPSPVAVTFAVADWVRNAATGCYEQTVACPGLLASDDKRTTVSPVGSTDAAAQKLTDAAEALVDRYACTADGQLYARCPENAPTVAFQVAVTVVRG